MDFSSTSLSIIEETSQIKRRSKRDSVLLETLLSTSFLTKGVRTESNCGHANQTEPRETALTYCNEMETAGKSYPMESSVLSPLAGTAYYLTPYVVQHALKLVFIQLVTSSEIWQGEEFENLQLKKENSPSHN